MKPYHTHFECCPFTHTFEIIMKDNSYANDALHSKSTDKSRKTPMSGVTMGIYGWQGLWCLTGLEKSAFLQPGFRTMNIFRNALEQWFPTYGLAWEQDGVYRAGCLPLSQGCLTAQL